VDELTVAAWRYDGALAHDDQTMKIGSIVIHCHEFERTVTFWQSALGYVPREPASGGWVVLRDPSRRGPNLSFQAREHPRPRRNWIHLDLYTSNQQAEVERLVSLGAKSYPWTYPPDADYVVLQDPDGNLFCVVRKTEDSAAAGYVG
jgi:catechol 2,3-dioxygenase-like lactoylglutathione lyase family enzyme